MAAPASGSTESLQMGRARPHVPAQGTLETVTPDWRSQVARRSSRTVRGRGPRWHRALFGLARLAAGTAGEWGGVRAGLREGVGPGSKPSGFHFKPRT